MKLFSFALLFLTCTRAFAAAPATRPVRAEAVSLQVQRPLSDAERDLVIGGLEGTTVNLILTGFDQSVVALDEKHCHLKTFTDDANTNLNKAEDFGLRPGWLSPFGTRISADAHACSIQILSPVVPAGAAAKVTLSGDFAFIVGSNPKTAEQKDAPLKKDAKVTAGPVPFSISNIEDTAMGDMKATITLTTDKPTSAIRTIAFFGADGKEIKSDNVGKSQMGIGDHETYDLQYGLAQRPDRLTVKITYFDKLETITVPFNVRAGLGL